MATTTTSALQKLAATYESTNGEVCRSGIVCDFPTLVDLANEIAGMDAQQPQQLSDFERSAFYVSHQIKVLCLSQDPSRLDLSRSRQNLVVSHQQSKDDDNDDLNQHLHHLDLAIANIANILNLWSSKANACSTHHHHRHQGGPPWKRQICQAVTALLLCKLRRATVASADIASGGEVGTNNLSSLQTEEINWRQNLIEEIQKVNCDLLSKIMILRHLPEIPTESQFACLATERHTIMAHLIDWILEPGLSLAFNLVQSQGQDVVLYETSTIEAICCFKAWIQLYAKVKVSPMSSSQQERRNSRTAATSPPDDEDRTNSAAETSARNQTTSLSLSLSLDSKLSDPLFWRVHSFPIFGLFGHALLSPVTTETACEAFEALCSLSSVWQPESQNTCFGLLTQLSSLEKKVQSASIETGMTGVSLPDLPPIGDSFYQTCPDLAPLTKSFVACVSVFAESHLPALLYGFPISYEVIRDILLTAVDCLLIPNIDIKFLVLDAFYAFMGHFASPQTETNMTQAESTALQTSRRKTLFPFFQPFVEHLLSSVIPYPAELCAEHTHSFDFELWSKFRDECALNLTDATLVLGCESILQAAGGELQSWILGARQNPQILVPWNRIESCLFVLTTVAPRAPAGKDLFIPVTLSLLPQLTPAHDKLQGLLMRSGAGRLILWTAGYISTQKQLFLQLVPLCASYLAFVADLKLARRTGELQWDPRADVLISQAECTIVEAVAAVVSAGGPLMSTCSQLKNHASLAEAKLDEVLNGATTIPASVGSISTMMPSPGGIASTHPSPPFLEVDLPDPSSSIIGSESATAIDAWQDEDTNDMLERLSMLVRVREFAPENRSALLLAVGTVVSSVRDTKRIKTLHRVLLGALKAMAEENSADDFGTADTTTHHTQGGSTTHHTQGGSYAAWKLFFTALQCVKLTGVSVVCPKSGEIVSRPFFSQSFLERSIIPDHGDDCGPWCHPTIEMLQEFWPTCQTLLQGPLTCTSEAVAEFVWHAASRILTDWPFHAVRYEVFEWAMVDLSESLARNQMMSQLSATRTIIQVFGFFTEPHVVTAILQPILVCVSEIVKILPTLPSNISPILDIHGMMLDVLASAFASPMLASKLFHSAGIVTDLLSAVLSFIPKCHHSKALSSAFHLVHRVVQWVDPASLSAAVPQHMAKEMCSDHQLVTPPESLSPSPMTVSQFRESWMTAVATANSLVLDLIAGQLWDRQIAVSILRAALSNFEPCEEWLSTVCQIFECLCVSDGFVCRVDELVASRQDWESETATETETATFCWRDEQQGHEIDSNVAVDDLSRLLGAKVRQFLDTIIKARDCSVGPNESPSASVLQECLELARMRWRRLQG